MVSLVAEDLTVEFSSGGYLIRPLHEFSFRAGDGELVVLLGPSGCGKTTLLSCLAGLLTPTAGSIDFDGTTVTGLVGGALAEYRRHTAGVVFQAFNLIPSLSARGNVMAPMRLARVPRREASARADGTGESGVRPRARTPRDQGRAPDPADGPSPFRDPAVTFTQAFHGCEHEKSWTL